MRLTLAMGEQPTVVPVQGQEVLQAALALPSGGWVDPASSSCHITPVALLASSCRATSLGSCASRLLAAHAFYTCHLGSRKRQHQIKNCLPSACFPTHPADPRERAGLYWGYTTRIVPSLAALLDPAQCPFEGGYDLTVGTSGAWLGCGSRITYTCKTWDGWSGNCLLCLCSASAHPCWHQLGALAEAVAHLFPPAALLVPPR